MLQRNSRILLRGCDGESMAENIQNPKKYKPSLKRWISTFLCAALIIPAFLSIYAIAVSLMGAFLQPNLSEGFNSIIDDINGPAIGLIFLFALVEMIALPSIIIAIIIAFLIRHKRWGCKATTYIVIGTISPFFVTAFLYFDKEPQAAIGMGFGIMPLGIILSGLSWWILWRYKIPNELH